MPPGLPQKTTKNQKPKKKKKTNKQLQTVTQLFTVISNLKTIPLKVKFLSSTQIILKHLG
jgi:hypothetical protein